MRVLKQITFASLVMISAVNAAEIKHRFLAKDESRDALRYVDQFNPANDWDLKLPGGCRDIRLIDENTVLISQGSGYLEYDLKTQKCLKNVKVLEDASIETVERLPNGNTILGGSKPYVTVYELDKNDQLVRKVAFPKMFGLRLLRTSPEGNLLFTANQNQMIEANWDGKILADIKVPGGKKMYWAKKYNNGEFYRVSTGFGCSVVDITPEGKVLRKISGREGDHTFARPFELKNGNIAVSHWTGHKSDASKEKPQIYEFDKDNNLVWQWHDTKRAGSIHGVIILE